MICIKGAVVREKYVNHKIKVITLSYHTIHNQLVNKLLWVAR